MRVNIKEVLFWVFLIISIILVLWMILGDSPSEFIVFVSVIAMMFMKISSISDKQVKTEIKTRNGFSRMKEDIELIKQNLNLIKKRLGI